MPKFLDAPSWYDETGTLRTLSGTVRFNSLAGFVDLPYTTFASGGARSSYYVLTSAGTNGNIAYSNGSYPMWLSNGTSGQVLTSNGNAAPSWKNLSLKQTNLYCHNVRMSHSYSATTYYSIIFSFFAERSTPYTTSSFSYMRNDIYSRYGVVGEGCYILAAGSAQGVDSVSILEVTTSSFIARRMPIGGDEYTITNASYLVDKCFAVLKSVSLST